jgi:hypothetical protein
LERWRRFTSFLITAFAFGTPGLAQERRPALTCDTRAISPGGARTPSLSFLGSLQSGDTVKVIVAWIGDTARRSVPRVHVASAGDSSTVQCGSRRQLRIELQGAWHRDSVIIQVSGADSIELTSRGHKVLAVRPPEKSQTAVRATRCSLLAIRNEPRFRCSA